jgi:hypothetical protein
MFGISPNKLKLIYEEIKSKLRSENACYYSLRNRLSARLLLKNIETNIYRTIILTVVLYGCKSWSLSH